MKRYNDFHPDDDRIPEMDDQFAQLCLNSLGAKPASDAGTDTDEAVWDESAIDYPGLLDQPEEPVMPEEPVIPEASVKPAAPVKPAATAVPVTSAAQAAQVKPAARAPQKKKAKKHRIRRFFLALIPQRGDSVPEIIRKCICIVAVLVFVGSACVLADDFIITPLRNKQISSASNQLLLDPLTPEEANYDGYPAGILEKFKKSYYKNHDLVGWITYPSTSPYWHGIDYAVVQHPGDNDYYLKRDINLSENKNGSIFMDFRCDYATKDSQCRVTLIYGHNMRDGQMFASLNQLLDLSMARCSPTFTFSSLFEENEYKVFAVFNVDTEEADAYDFLNQSVASDDDFVRYIAEMRVRSWFDYSSVDVNVSDEIVVLYTCSNTYQTTMGKSGRTLVAARKVRPGESTAVDTSTITENDNCVMPKVWYANKGLSLPDYYQNGVPAAYLDAVDRTPTTTVAPTTTTKNTKTTKKTTTTTSAGDEPKPDEPDDDYDDDDDVIAPTSPARTTRPATPTRTAATTKPTTPTTVITPTKPTTASTEPAPTEPAPTEPAPTEPEPTEPEPTEPAGPVGPDMTP